MNTKRILAIGISLLALGANSLWAASEPLKLELPKPLFMGTPKPVGNIPNLETRRQGERPDFMVPEGTKLLSADKPVTSSDDWPIIGEIEFVTDGDKDGDEGYYVELGPDLQWVQIDLEQEAALHAIVVWHYHAEPRVYHDVVVQVSNDEDFESGVTTVFNNDYDNSAGFGKGDDPSYQETYEGRIIDPNGVEARYVRLYSRGNTSNQMNHFIEVEVYGKS